MAKKATSKDYQIYSNWQEAQNLSSYGSRGVPNKPVAIGGKKTVPEVLDWGKGIPRDYLAYLNKQEMALVQNARKFKGKRSYKGIPAYPDPGDTAAGDTGQGTSSSAGLGNNTSPGNYRSSDDRYTSSVGTSSNQNTTDSSSDNDTSVSGSESGPNRGIGSTSITTDTSAQQAAAESDATSVVRTNSALKSDALKGGIGAINVGPENAAVPVGGQIKGAIASSSSVAYKNQPTSPPASTVSSTPTYHWNTDPAETNTTVVYKDPGSTYSPVSQSSYASPSAITGPVQGPTTYRGVTADYTNGPTYTPGGSETVNSVMSNRSLADYGRINANDSYGGISDLSDDGIPRDAAGNPIGPETPGSSSIGTERILSVENVPEETTGPSVSPSQEGIGQLQNYPKPQTEEEKKRLEDQENLNRKVLTAVGKVPIIGPALRIGQGIYKMATGNDIASASTALKNEYDQAGPDKQKYMREHYSNIRSYAQSKGEDTSGDSYNQDYAGGPTMNQGGQDTGSRVGILSLEAQERMRNKQEADAAAAAAAAAEEANRPKTDRELYDYGAFAGNRPAKYYQWDLGMRIPKPGDPDYNEYRYYLKQRRVNYA